MEQRYTRRGALRAAGGLAAAGALAPYGPWLDRAAAAGLRTPDSLPDPMRPAGTPTDALPFDHIVCLMQENHSFDNYFGMLPRRGQPKADGFSFDAAGVPLNSNPYKGGIVRVQHASSACQPPDITQAWTPTHEEIDNGKMDGFATVDVPQMLYYDESDIPFYYSFANAFCVGNRWFCSAPCQTYPNRRFYLCGTAFGLISTTTSSITQSPPNGTIFDRLSHYGITWKDYFVDVPGTAVILETVEKYPLNMAPIAEFYLDCAAGTLPAVSFVDPEIGLLNVVGSQLASSIPIGNGIDQFIAAQDQDEENPADIQLGESFINGIVDSVLKSPAWPRTLIVWIYDEHGGYYDHVPPPAAILPDTIKPVLGANDYPGGYNIYGPRVPAVVASPYSKPHDVTDVVHDHTSVLATIEAKWNLPACTYRDANAATVADFLDTSSKPALLEPPVLAGVGDVLGGELNCKPLDPTFEVLPAPPALKPPRLILRVEGYRRKAHGIVVDLHTTSGALTGLEVEVVHRGRVIARRRIARVTTHRRRLVVHHRLAHGSYTVRVRHADRTVAHGELRVR
jgi:phospholipase C